MPVLVAVAVLAVALFGSTSYLQAFKLEREPAVVVIGALPELTGAAELLALAYEAANSGIDVAVVAVDAADELDAALEDGTVDLVFGAVTALEAAGLDAGPEPALRLATLVTVPFPSDKLSVTLDEARSLIAEVAAGGSGPWADDPVTVIGLGQRSPDRQLLTVDGVYPTLATVLDGTYPLSSEVGFARRELSGLAGFLAGLPGVEGWLAPNQEAVDGFYTWLSGAEARSAFYGATGEFRLAAIGDVMLARKTQREIDQFGIQYAFGNVAERLSSADLTFCNLEAPLGDTGVAIPGKVIWLRGRPEFIQCLEHAGIDVVSVCNNHILDYDSPCMLQTLDLLEGAGMTYVGGGRNVDDARTVRVVEVAGTKVAFIGYTEFASSWLFWDYGHRRTFLASDTEPGCNPLDMAIIEEDIARAKELADLVCVSFHWGTEDVRYPTPFDPFNPQDFEAIAHRVVDLGASVVLGHHPHIVQGFEVYRGAVIAYSLGNFVNDQARPHQKEGTILELQLGPEGVLSARVTPVWIESTAPDFMTGQQLQETMEVIEEISEGLTTN